MNRLRVALVTILGVPLLLFAASFALAAANVVPASKAGDGAGGITGYTVSNLSYTLNGTNPQNIDQVDFDVDTAPLAGSTMEVKLVAAGSDWYSCTNVTTAITCVTTAPQATVASADEFRVVIVQ